MLVFYFFTVMNLHSLLGAYDLSDALQDDLLSQLELVKDHGLSSTHVVFHSMGYEHQRLAALLIHVIIGAMVLCMVWFRRFSLRIGDAINNGKGIDKA